MCQQAYAWNLDYVVDVHGNSQAFYYTQDMNYYSTAAGTGPTHIYVRASRLARVDYGMRAGAELTSKAPMIVNFGYTGRCEQGSDCSAGNDVPYEEFNCSTASGCTVQAPTFYTHYRLWTVLSQTLVNGTSYGNTDYWYLQHSMPNPYDAVGARPALWFKSITHSGADTTSTGITSWITDPPTLFDGHGKKNRVWDVRSGQGNDEPHPPGLDPEQHRRDHHRRIQTARLHRGRRQSKRHRRHRSGEQHEDVLPTVVGAHRTHRAARDDVVLQRLPGRTGDHNAQHGR
ncbi:hypothetical protein AAHB34_20325 [Paenarthrobacter ureafaciens]